MRRSILLAVLCQVAPWPSLVAQEPPALPPRAALPADLTGARPAPIPEGFGYPVLDVDRERILDLLRLGRFAELDRLFESLKAATNRNIRRENELVDAYESFFGSDREIGARLDEWATASYPRSAAPLIAKAQFLRARAWEARGTQRLTDADSTRVDEMHAHLEAGLDAAVMAGRVDPQNLAVYSTMLGLIFPWGWSDGAEQLLDSALVRFPTSHRLRFQALAGMTPRWGGSYEAMQRRIDEAQEHAAANPRLRTLRGAIALDRANELSLDHRQAEALAAVEDARAFETDWYFHYRRGRILFISRDYVRAVEELNEAVARRPLSTSVLEYRGRALGRIAQYLAPPERRAEFLGYAEADLREAATFSQADSTLATWLTWTSESKVACARTPTICIQPSGTDGRSGFPEPETWLGRVALFLVSVPLTLFFVLSEGDRLYLLPAPILGAVSLVWNFVAWRRQRYWTPRIIPALSVLAFLLLVWINLNWISFGGGMWTQRVVVIAVSALVPYAVYLMMGGPRYMARTGRVPGAAPLAARRPAPYRAP